MLIYTAEHTPYGDHLVYVASKRFPDDAALLAAFKTEDAADLYVRLKNEAEESNLYRGAE